MPSGRLVEGMPLGLQFAAPFGMDEELLGACARLEALLRAP
jgi:Asp-tRNA(Asn)/Glu-tRNA(Gln) amidotransferase A subunit family amidase